LLTLNLISGAPDLVKGPGQFDELLPPPPLLLDDMEIDELDMLGALLLIYD
jgi:hypothetical protein